MNKNVFCLMAMVVGILFAGPAQAMEDSKEAFDGEIETKAAVSDLKEIVVVAVPTSYVMQLWKKYFCRTPAAPSMGLCSSTGAAASSSLASSSSSSVEMAVVPTSMSASSADSATGGSKKVQAASAFDALFDDHDLVGIIGAYLVDPENKNHLLTIVGVLEDMEGAAAASPAIVVQLDQANNPHRAWEHSPLKLLVQWLTSVHAETIRQVDTLDDHKRAELLRLADDRDAVKAVRQILVNFKRHGVNLCAQEFRDEKGVNLLQRAKEAGHTGIVDLLGQYDRGLFVLPENNGGIAIDGGCLCSDCVIYHRVCCRGCLDKCLCDCCCCKRTCYCPCSNSPCDTTLCCTRRSLYITYVCLALCGVAAVVMIECGVFG